MAVDKNSGEIISLDEAVHFTHSFQENNPDALKAFFVGTNNLKRIPNGTTVSGFVFTTAMTLHKIKPTLFW